MGVLIQVGPTFINSYRRSTVDKKTMFERIEEAGEYFGGLDFDISKPKIFVEFRHTSWFQESVYKMLRDVGWNLVYVMCNNSSKSFGDLVSGSNPPFYSAHIDFTKYFKTIMIRCHGTHDRAYHGGYSTAELWDMYVFSKIFDESYIIFDNTDSMCISTTKFEAVIKNPRDAYLPDAVDSALRMKELVRKRDLNHIQR